MWEAVQKSLSLRISVPFGSVAPWWKADLAHQALSLSSEQNKTSFMAMDLAQQLKCLGLNPGTKKQKSFIYKTVTRNVI